MSSRSKLFQSLELLRFALGEPEVLRQLLVRAAEVWLGVIGLALRVQALGQLFEKVPVGFVGGLRLLDDLAVDGDGVVELALHAEGFRDAVSRDAQLARLVLLATNVDDGELEQEDLIVLIARDGMRRSRLVEAAGRIEDVSRRPDWVLLIRSDEALSDHPVAQLTNGAPP